MKALIAMSGGVDSSVAAYLTQKEGFTCIGGTAQMCDQAILGDAFNQQGVEDAKAVADYITVSNNEHAIAAIIEGIENGKFRVK